MARVTIKDVARHAGVVPSTVSRAINNHPEINAHTRERVLRSIEALGYIPDPGGKTLRTRRTRSVSVILPTLEGDFYSRLMNSMDEALADCDYDAGVFPLLSERRLARYQDPRALPYHTDGLVFASLDPDHLYPNPAFLSNIPVVLLDIENPRYDRVVLHNERGGYLAARQLQLRPAPTFVMNVEERFHTPFASGVFQKRLTGFQRAQEEAGLTLEPGQVVTSPFLPDAARRAARQLLERAAGPTNIFAACDLFARALLEEASLMGRRVGEELRLVGFDDDSAAQHLQLTTIHQPVEQMGRELVRLLMERLGNPGLPIRARQIEPVLVLRGTA